MTSLNELYRKFVTAKFLIDNLAQATHPRRLVKLHPQTFSSTPAAAETHLDAFKKKHRPKPQHRG